MFDKFIYVIGLLLIFISILFLTYITTRYIGRSSRYANNAKHLKIIETICLGKDKYLYLVKVGNKYILISSSIKGLDMLGDIDLGIDESIETIEKEIEQSDGFQSFKSIINRYVSSKFPKNR